MASRFSRDMVLSWFSSVPSISQKNAIFLFSVFIIYLSFSEIKSKFADIQPSVALPMHQLGVTWLLNFTLSWWSTSKPARS